MNLPESKLPETDAQSEEHWSRRRESGAHVAMSLAAAIYRVLGRSIMRLLLYPIITYFYLTNPKARRASGEYLARVYAFDQSSVSASSPALQRAPDWRDSAKHFMSFGRAIVDRIASWVGDLRREDVVFENRQMLLDCIASGSGGFILSSHLGNAEVCRALVDSVADVKMNVLVFNDNAKQINQMMRRLNPRAEVELIQIATVDPGTAIKLSQKVQQGELVIIAADRTSPTSPEKSVEAQFLGEVAAFPQGAFILASLMDCPVFLMFCLHRGQYHIYLEHFADRMLLPRRERAELLRGYVQRYAERLQHYVLLEPYQWFNFFDFWAKPTKPSTSSKNSQR